MPPELDDSPNPSDTNNDQPKPEDQFGNIANAAAKNQLTRFSEKVLPGIIAKVMEPLMAEIASLKAPKPDADEDSVKKGGKASPEVEAMKAQIEEFKNRLSSEQNARVAAEKKSRDDGALSALRSELSPHVRPELLGVLANELFHQRKVVDYDDDGTPLFKSKKIDMYGDPEEVRMPLKDGVLHFLKSEDAKAFLPAPSGGSGAPPMRKSGAKSSTPFNAETASEADKIRNALEVVQRAQQRGVT